MYKNRYMMLIVMPKNVSEIMTVKIETIGLEDTAQTAAKKMKEKNVSSLVVMDVSGRYCYRTRPRLTSMLS